MTKWIKKKLKAGITKKEKPKSWITKKTKPVQSRSRHQSVAEDKRLLPRDKFNRDVLGQDMSDKYKEIKVSNKQADLTKHKKAVDPSKMRQQRKEQQKQATRQYQKQHLTKDYAYTGIPGAKATAKGVKYNKGGRAGFQHGGRANFRRGGKGTGPTPGQRIKARKAKAHEWWTGHTGTQGIYSPTIDKKLREKRPHSSPEGRMRDVKKIMADAKIAGKRRKWPGRTKKRPPNIMQPYRAKHGIGNIVKGVKKIISKVTKPSGVFKPKPKGKGLGSGVKPSEMKEIIPKKDRKLYLKEKLANPLPTHLRGPSPHRKVSSSDLKKLEKIKAQPIPHKTQKLIKKLQKAYKGKAGGGRISRGHGGSAAQQHYLQYGYGPTKAKLRSGKPKIAKKGWA